MRQVVGVGPETGSGEVPAHGDVGDEDPYRYRPPRLTEEAVSDQHPDQQNESFQAEPRPGRAGDDTFARSNHLFLNG